MVDFKEAQELIQELFIAKARMIFGNKTNRVLLE